MPRRVLRAIESVGGATFVAMVRRTSCCLDLFREERLNRLTWSSNMVVEPNMALELRIQTTASLTGSRFLWTILVRNSPGFMSKPCKAPWNLQKSMWLLEQPNT